jgi:hypothetical protein
MRYGFKEARRNHGAFRVILGGNDGGLCAKRTVLAFNENKIGKLERMPTLKQNFLRSAKFDEGFAEGNPGTGRIMVVIPTVVVPTLARCGMGGATQPNRDTNRSRVGKELGQSADDFRVEGAGRSTCLAGHLYPQFRGLRRRVTPHPGLEEPQGDSRCVIGGLRCTMHATLFKDMH